VQSKAPVTLLQESPKTATGNTQLSKYKANIVEHVQEGHNLLISSGDDRAQAWAARIFGAYLEKSVMEKGSPLWISLPVHIHRIRESIGIDTPPDLLADMNNLYSAPLLVLDNFNIAQESLKDWDTGNVLPFMLHRNSQRLSTICVMKDPYPRFGLQTNFTFWKEVGID
jgi:hypothetical protein